MKLEFAIVVAALGVGCGYRAAYSSERPQGRLSVTAAPHRVARTEAVQMVLAGARAELSRAGVLAPGSRYPRLVVEVLRVDERPIGIAALGSGDAERPVGRGTAVAVTARGFVVETAGAQPSRDTGDVRRVERVGSSVDPRAAAATHDAAVRAAARRAGQALARRILGTAEPSVEPL